MNIRKEDNGTITLNWDPDEEIEIHLRGEGDKARKMILRPMVFVDNKLKSSVEYADSRDGDVDWLEPCDEQPFTVTQRLKNVDVLITLVEI